jgi:hyperosmotically inducible periplasmic protein
VRFEEVEVMRKWLLGLALTMGIAAAKPVVPLTDDGIVKKTGHEIRMYPRYTIWDNITYRVQNGNVELNGEVSQPYKKDDIARLVQRIPGVASVTSNIKVLPLSPNDDRLRLQVARAIFRDPVLSRYSMEPIPPIHIIVDNGHVTLEGVVATQTEKNVAGIRASASGLSFGAITNNLVVENSKNKS